MNTRELLELFFLIAPAGTVLEVLPRLAARVQVGHVSSDTQEFQLWSIVTTQGSRAALLCKSCASAERWTPVTQEHASRLLLGDRDLVRALVGAHVHAAVEVR